MEHETRTDHVSDQVETLAGDGALARRARRPSPIP